MSFMDLVEIEPYSGCWLWSGALDESGYGKAKRVENGKRRTLGAHRVSFLNSGKTIPDGHVLDHKCRIRCCVNPKHLEPVTQRENVSRGNLKFVSMQRAIKITHCPSGHEYSETNTRIRRGKRECKTCDNIRACAYGKKKRAEAKLKNKPTE